mmetsp:Transcript_26553/g.26216  ORF Transcript_26553/g.26216 Transcript_26553/m.26216 type:complete len:87 (+) Transcript_26553:184-444(+)
MIVNFSCFSTSCRLDSTTVSKALVASSKTKIFGFLIRALAMATLCFCPPLSLLPLSPTSLSRPYFSKRSPACAFIKASLASSSVAS